MSNYTSANTIILATHRQGDNTRMLLLHQFTDSGRIEYVIGSYFTVESMGKFGSDRYSWDWGHYFGSVVSAVDYWRSEVLGDGCDERTCPHCGGEDDWSDIEWEDPCNGEIDAWARCPICDGLHKLEWKLAGNIPVEG